MRLIDDVCLPTAKHRTEADVSLYLSDGLHGAFVPVHFGNIEIIGYLLGNDLGQGCFAGAAGPLYPECVPVPVRPIGDAVQGRDNLGLADKIG